MICPKCKATIPDSKFCPECGHALKALAVADRQTQVVTSETGIADDENEPIEGSYRVMASAIIDDGRRGLLCVWVKPNETGDVATATPIDGTPGRKLRAMVNPTNSSLADATFHKVPLGDYRVQWRDRVVEISVTSEHEPTYVDWRR